MALPILKLNLVPPPTPWRVYHNAMGWSVLAAGILALATTLAATAMAYRQALLAGRNIVTLDTRSRELTRKQTELQNRLQSIDVDKELPRWRLAERILTERGVPWSRLMAELERSLVQDVRCRSIQRTRDNAQNIQVKLKLEAKNSAAEDAFLKSLQQNAFFQGVILEREGEGSAGILDLECTLPVSRTPLPYTPLPKYGPIRKTGTPAPSKPMGTSRNVPVPPAFQPQTSHPVQRPMPSPEQRPIQRPERNEFHPEPRRYPMPNPPGSRP